jgi:hypothetical protein
LPAKRWLTGWRAKVALITLVLLTPATAMAEWQIKPALGVTLGGRTTFIDLEEAVGTPNVTFSVNGVLLGEILGIEVDFGLVPGLFDRSGRQSPFAQQAIEAACDETCVKSSLVTTYTVNAVIAAPRRLSEYSLRPYIVGGGGLMRVSVTESLGLYDGVSPVNMSALDAGAGVTGFLTDRLGLNWDLRWFRSLRGRQQGVSLGREKLSFWRASMALAIRY